MQFDEVAALPTCLHASITPDGAWVLEHERCLVDQTHANDCMHMATHSGTGEIALFRIICTSRLRYPITTTDCALLTKLVHPNIVRHYETQKDAQGQWLFVRLEPCYGGELFDEIAESGPLPEAVARNYFRSIVSAVLYCHSHGIAHGGLRPENVRLDTSTEQHRLLLHCEPGYTTHCSELQGKVSGARSPLQLGSMVYLPPEALAAGITDPFRADCWSLGVLLHSMLTGTPPFSIASPRCRRFHLHATGSDIFANTCLSTSAKEMLRGLLDVDDDQRWECKQVFNCMWLQDCGGAESSVLTTQENSWLSGWSDLKCHLPCGGQGQGAPADGDMCLQNAQTVHMAPQRLLNVSVPLSPPEPARIKRLGWLCPPADAGYLLHRASLALRELKASALQVNYQQAFVTASITEQEQDSDKPEQFCHGRCIVGVYLHQAADNWVRVTVLRCTGDTFCFHRAYRSIRASLGDLVAGSAAFAEAKHSASTTLLGSAHSAGEPSCMSGVITYESMTVA